MNATDLYITVIIHATATPNREKVSISIRVWSTSTVPGINTVAVIF
jgi:hypothetical protein